MLTPERRITLLTGTVTSLPHVTRHHPYPLSTATSGPSLASGLLHPLTAPSTLTDVALEPATTDLARAAPTSEAAPASPAPLRASHRTTRLSFANSGRRRPRRTRRGRAGSSGAGRPRTRMSGATRLVSRMGGFPATRRHTSTRTSVDEKALELDWSANRS
jgi:hypothetical protein